MKQLIFTVPGDPRAKKRHRTVPAHQCLSCQKRVQGMYKECPSCGGALRFLTNMSYSDSESVKYENLVSYCAQQAMATQNVSQFTGPTRMRMTFLFPIPVSRLCKKCSSIYTNVSNKMDLDPAWKGAEETAAIRCGCKKLHATDPHTQRPDVDNCVKSILDGGNGIIFADDCIIVELTAKKQWASEGRAEVVVEEI